MMRKSLLAAGFALGFAIAVVGCRSVAPPVVYYTLSPITVSAEEADAAGRPSGVIGIRPVDLPGTVNRLQMVVRTGANQLSISSLHRWADYPDRLVQQIMVENLQALMPNARVIGSPWPMGLAPAVSVTLTFLELIAAEDRVLLNAMWLNRSADLAQAPQPHRLKIDEPLSGSGFEQIAAAHSRALATLSRAVADSLRGDGD